VIGWLSINIPIFTLFGLVGVDIFLSRLHWFAQYLIWHYSEILELQRADGPSWGEGELIAMFFSIGFVPVYFAFDFFAMSYLPDY
jgi:hypothetical protein